ncbi:YncE family protein [Sandaracinus amylolyticus]|uniref:YncE family protein n=1 Tax=Sandaracinus amylolyticus TaxID=927083 RepID=UPI001F468326|nr:YncE family protein [Sandaracinus amylolyticus]UJR85133.1 Hypothetical protein I5071_72130 [Sandaracinus amylolyticus]
MRRGGWIVAALALGACGGEARGGQDAGVVIDAEVPCVASADPSRLVVTADWMSRSLTLLGLERVLDPGCSADEAIVGRIDLAAWAPGPLEVEVAPDGRTAVVAVAPGFMSDEPDHALLVVDLEARAVLGEIELTDAPMGIAIAPDGARAYVACFGTSDARGERLAIVDLATRTLVEEVEVGPRPEQVALSDDGSIGVVSLGGSDGVRVFRTSDVAGTLTGEIVVGLDPSDVAFVPGTDRFVVATSMRLGFAVVDVTDPAVPTVVAMPSLSGGIPYGAAWIPGTEDVLLTTSVREQLVRVSAREPERAPVPTAIGGGGFLISVAVTPDGTHAITAHAQTHVLSVVELATGASHTLSWLEQRGPTWVVIQP